MKCVRCQENETDHGQQLCGDCFVNYIPEHKTSQDWEDLKQQGAEHYRSGEVEPIDLFKAGGMLQDPLLKDIIKYAYRCRIQAKRPTDLILQDLKKIIHYARLLFAYLEEENDRL